MSLQKVTRRGAPLFNSRGWGAACGALLLGACAGFGQPTVASHITPLDQFDAGRAIRSAPAGADIGAKWWQDFGDAALNRLVDDAMRDAPTLKAMQQRVVEALAQADAEHAAALPQVDGQASVAPTRYPADYTTPPPAAGHWLSNTQALLNLSFDLDLAGRISAQTRSAERRAYRQAALAQGAAVALQAAVVTTYLNLALDTQLLKIDNDSLAQCNDLLRLTDRRVAAGLDMRVASLRASEPIPLAQAEISRRTAEIAVLRHRLAALVGRGPGYTDTLSPVPTLLAQTPLVPTQLPAGLVGRRPDVIAARYGVEAQAAGIDAARAAFYPDINLIAFAGWQSLGFRALFNGNSGSFGAGPALTLPIFEGGRLRADLRAQTAVYDAAVADYDDTVAQALAQVSDALVNLQALHQQRDLTDQALQRAQQTYDLETRRYRQGVSGYLDVLLAENRLNEDRALHAHAESALLVEHVQLIAALGGAATDGVSQ